MILLLFTAVCFLAYSNGANDNFKGVASLFGSNTTTYRTALIWATLTTGGGSVAALFLAQSLLKKFSGKGLVPDALTAEPAFLMAVAMGAAGTVFLATWRGFPISTTHSLTGALLGAGLLATPSAVNFGALGKSFIAPLLFAPVIAIALGAALYSLLRLARLGGRIDKEVCVCVGSERQTLAVPRPGGVLAVECLPQISVSLGTLPICQQRYVGHFLGMQVGPVVDALHFLSAGAVSFARGLNDTPKIAALLLVATTFKLEWNIAAIGLAIALGGWFNARKVAETMAHKITTMSPGQGLAANLATALLVNTASYHGLPVSTTHVSVGSLCGIGLATGKLEYGTMRNILLSWVVTLPCAGALSALAYGLFSRL